MLDMKKFKRKLLMRALLSAQSMGPLTVGFLALMVMFFIGIKALPLFIIGVGGMFLGAAAGLKRLMLPNPKMTDEIMAEINREKAEEEERRLNDLQRKLRADGDSRTDTLLSDLRSIMAAFRSEKISSATADKDGSFDALGVGKLFDGCVRALEQTLALHAQALEMKNPQIRAGYLERRELLIKKVEEIIVRIGLLHAKAQQLNVRGEDDAGAKLQASQDEFETNLRILAEADRVMQGFDSNDNDYAKFDKHADTLK
jgi:hypothetical protein